MLVEGNNRAGEDPRTVGFEKETATRRCLCGELGPKSQPAATAQGCLPGTQISAPGTCRMLLSLPPPIKAFLVLCFAQWGETCPIQSEVHSYIFICIYVDQSEQLHNNKSDHVKPTNQNSAIWTNKMVQI